MTIPLPRSTFTERINCDLTVCPNEGVNNLSEIVYFCDLHKGHAETVFAEWLAPILKEGLV